MTDAVIRKAANPQKHSTMRNTLRCISVLSVIAVVCVTLLAVANRFLQAEVTLDKATSALINRIAPTGADDDTAYSSGYIRMADLQKGGYGITDLEAYNKKYGSSSQKVRALYTSTHKDTQKTTLVVEAEGKGYVDAVVMLIAYDEEGKISGLTTKSQSESYWSHIKDPEKLYAAFVGMSGAVTVNEIAASTGVTVRGTLGGITSAVSLANDFMARLGGATAKPTQETDTAKLAQLAKVSSASSFIRYPVGSATVVSVYEGNNGDIVVEAKGSGGAYGAVTMLVKVTDGKVDRVTLTDSSSFDPQEGHDSAPLQNDATLNAVFAGKTLADVNGMGNLAGTTGVTQSNNGIKDAVKNALNAAASFDKTQFGEVEA